MPAVFHSAEDSRTALRSVLIGTDLTSYPSASVTGALRLPLAPGARLTLAHVLGADAPKASASEAAERLHAYRAGMLAAHPDLEVDVIISRGDVCGELARCAMASSAELIVVAGARARGLLFPSTIADVVARARVPVLVVDRSHSPYVSALAAVERAGPASASALVLARRLVEPTSATLDVVHPLPSDVERRLRGGRAPLDAIDAARRRLRSMRAQEMQGWLRDVDLGPLRPRLWIVSGEPVDAVLEVLRNVAPDLLVLAADAHWLRGGALRSSVAGRLIVRARCDVLITRPASETERATVGRRLAA